MKSMEGEGNGKLGELPPDVRDILMHPETTDPLATFAT